MKVFERFLTEDRSIVRGLDAMRNNEVIFKIAIPWKCDGISHALCRPSREFHKARQRSQNFMLAVATCKSRSGTAYYSENFSAWGTSRDDFVKAVQPTPAALARAIF